MALFSGKATVEADLPHDGGAGVVWGRALSRESLDGLLLERARQEGAAVRQPWRVRSIVQDAYSYQCHTEAPAGGTETIRARIVVAAHGSWDPGTLATQPPRQPHAAADLLGFKAHFMNTALPSDLMPLLAFRGGYGGMVHTEAERVSLSCCVRRDQLQALHSTETTDAGDAVLKHIRKCCPAVDRVLAGARRHGPWIAAGPIRPGLRLRPNGGIFPVGNAAGEVHPVIAEGISIALQSAWLLCERLISWKGRGASGAELPRVADAYAAAWRGHFASRLQLSRLIAAWAMRPAAVACLVPLFRHCPPLLSWFARLSGKTHGVVR